MKKTLALLVALALAPLAGFAATGNARPNIIYFLVDDLGYADCGFNGGTDIRTPNLDKLAKAGAVLKSFYVQPLCSPTRAALLTGRYPTRTGVYSVVTPGAPWGLPLDERTLPQALVEAGYTTAICGKWHLGEFRADYRPTQRGFQHQYGCMMGNLDYFTHIRDGKLDWYRDDKPLEEEGYTTRLIAKEASRLIKAQPADKPLFLYVPFNGVHSPYQVPEADARPYESLPKLRRTVAGMLAVVDEAIGQITAALDEKGMRENTLLIFCSDNGGAKAGNGTMNTPLRGGKGGLYEGGIRVAAFAAWPGKITAGTTINEPMHIVDWYPTLLKLAGANITQKHAPDGRDVWPVLTQGAKSPHDAILLHGTTLDEKAIRMGDWKLILPKSGKMALYNLAADIAEKNDLAAAEPDRVKTMRARLDEFTKDAKPLGASIHRGLLHSREELELVKSKIASGEEPWKAAITVTAGGLPIILTAPHGGSAAIPGVPVRKGDGVPKFNPRADANTHMVTEKLADALEQKLGKRPYVMMARLHRKYIDSNRRPQEAYESPEAKAAYDAYHAAIAAACREVTARWGRGIVLDIHRQAMLPGVVFRGTQNGRTVTPILRIIFIAAATTVSMASAAT